MVAPPSREPSAAPPPESDGAYRAVEAPDLWHVASLACFAGALAARPIVRWLPPGLRFGLYGPTLVVLLTLGFAALGCLLAWRGTRRPEICALSRFALLLNATVLGLALLAALVGVWIFVR